MRGGVVMQYAGGETSDFKGTEGGIWFKWEEGLLCNAGRGGDIWYKEGGFVKQGIRYLI